MTKSKVPSIQDTHRPRNSVHYSGHRSGLLSRVSVLVVLSVFTLLSIPAPSALAGDEPPLPERLILDEVVGVVRLYDRANQGLNWTRRVTGYLIRDDVGITSAKSVLVLFPRAKSNCWQVAAVNAFGTGPWSNEVCYTPPLPVAPKLAINSLGLEIQIPIVLGANGDLQVKRIAIRDKFGTTDLASSVSGATIKINWNKSNCWEAAGISGAGQGPWSQQVCYSVPVLRSSPIAKGSYAIRCETSAVQLSWIGGSLPGDIITSTVIRDDLGQTYQLSPESLDVILPAADCSKSRQYSVAYENESGVWPWILLGGYRAAVASTTPATVLIRDPGLESTTESSPRRRVGALCADLSVVGDIGPSACSRRGGRVAWIVPVGDGSFQTYRDSTCIGVCFGVPSVVNGLPRNTYVSGYFRSDGTYVRPYTRSK